MSDTESKYFDSLNNALEARRQAFALAVAVAEEARHRGADVVRAVRLAAELPPGPPTVLADSFWDRVPKAPPVPMRLHCPGVVTKNLGTEDEPNYVQAVCGVLHVDQGEFEIKPHHTHACQACGHVWRPAVVPTVGVRFLPGFKDA